MKGWDTNGCVWETASKRWKSCLAPWLLVFPKRGGGEGEKEKIGGGERERREERRETVYSRPAVCIFFRNRRDATVFPPEDALFLIARIRIDNVRLVYKEGPLWETLVPWNIVMQRVVTDCPSFDLKSLCHTYTPFAECAGWIRRRAISGAVNRKRKSKSTSLPIFLLPFSPHSRIFNKFLRSFFFFIN